MVLRGLGEGGGERGASARDWLCACFRVRSSVFFFHVTPHMVQYYTNHSTASSASLSVSSTSGTWEYVPDAAASSCQYDLLATVVNLSGPVQLACEQEINLLRILLIMVVRIFA